MLWIKAFHIIFVVSWFAGLFYLPRIYVNLAMVDSQISVAEYDRLLLMARKLLRFMSILAVPAVLLGFWLWLGFGIGKGQGNGWLHVKILIVLLVLIYHIYCVILLQDFCKKNKRRSHIWFRWFNEIPVLLLTAAVILAVVKPF